MGREQHRTRLVRTWSGSCIHDCLIFLRSLSNLPASHVASIPTRTQKGDTSQHIFELCLNLHSQFMDKRLFIHLQGGRKVSGTLRGFDIFLNLVIDDAIEETTPAQKTSIGTVVSHTKSLTHHIIAHGRNLGHTRQQCDNDGNSRGSPMISFWLELKCIVFALSINVLHLRRRTAHRHHPHRHRLHRQRSFLLPHLELARRSKGGPYHPPNLSSLRGIMILGDTAWSRISNLRGQGFLRGIEVQAESAVLRDLGPILPCLRHVLELPGQCRRND